MSTCEAHVTEEMMPLKVSEFVVRGRRTPHQKQGMLLNFAGSNTMATQDEPPVSAGEAAAGACEILLKLIPRDFTGHFPCIQIHKPHRSLRRDCKTHLPSTMLSWARCRSFLWHMSKTITFVNRQNSFCLNNCNYSKNCTINIE